MLKRIFGLSWVVVFMVFAVVFRVDASWQLTPTSSSSLVDANSGNGWTRAKARFTNGNCWVTVLATYNGGLIGLSSKSWTISSWIRKRYDWTNPNTTPTSVTKNFNVNVQPEAECTVQAFTFPLCGSTVSASAYASASASVSGGGGTRVDEKGKAEVNLSATHGSIFSNWSLSFGTSQPPTGTVTQNGNGAFKTTKKHGSAMIGGGYTFSQNGAQIFASCSGSSTATQQGGEWALANSITLIHAFDF